MAEQLYSFPEKFILKVWLQMYYYGITDAYDLISVYIVTTKSKS